MGPEDHGKPQLGLMERNKYYLENCPKHQEHWCHQMPGDVVTGHDLAGAVIGEE